MAASTKPPPIQRDWLSKTAAGVLLGGTAAFACSAIFAGLTTALPLPIRAQLTMWLVMPVWLSIVAGTYYFQSGRRAWLWLAGANVGLLAAAAALRMG